MEFSATQEEIIRTNKDKVVVMSGAGSGKTLVITERVKYLLENKIVKPEELVVITYTNNAAQEMLSRLGKLARGAFIGTIHAYGYYLLITKGFELGEYIEEDNFDEFFRLIEANPEVLRKVDYLLVDEFQDCSELTANFIFNMIKPERWMIVGDIKQSIFRFINANPEIMIGLSRKKDVVVYDMDENFRNAKNILAFAKRIISVLGYEYIDLSIATREEAGSVLKFEDYTPEKLANFVKLHMEREGETYKDWFILSRTNQERDILFNTFNTEGIPADTFKKTDMSNAELKKKMEENTVKILTIHQAKGLENKCVAVVGAKYYNTEERCIAYVAATRAKDVLVWCQPKKKKKRYTTWE